LAVAGNSGQDAASYLVKLPKAEERLEEYRQ
jgi:hypothetical protein